MARHGRSDNPQYDSATTVYRDGQEYIRVRKRARKRSTARKVLVGVLVALLVVLLAVGGYLLWFTSQLNNRLAPGEGQGDLIAALGDKAAQQTQDSGYYVLLVGSDSRMDAEELSQYEFEDNTYTNQRADIMVLVRVDESAKQLTLLTIPRDTPWRNEQGEYMKLNAVYSYHGAAGAIEAVEQLCGVSISHYGEVHLAEFPQMIDSLGGITVNVPVSMVGANMVTGETIYLEPGVQHLNGQEAMVLARSRTRYESDEDYHRQESVRAVIEAIFKEIATKPAWEIPEAVLACAECATTDMDAMSLAQLMLSLGTNARIYQGTGPWDGDDNLYLDAWYCYENPDGWARVMDAVRAGENPANVTYEEDAVTVAGSGE